MPRRPIYAYRREVDYVSGAALAVPRPLFLELGGFDPCYAPAYYEDVDLAFKVRDAGRRVIFQPRSVVVHHEGVTSGRDVASGVKSHQVTNAKTFLTRWKSRLASHHEPGQPVERARERGAQFRVLFLDHCTPEPDKDAGSGAVLHLFRILQGLGGKVTFIPEDNYLFLDPYTPDLQRMGVECLYAPFVTSVKEHLQDAADRYDLILMYRYTTAVRHLAAIRRYAKRAKVVLLDVDLHFLREMREADLRQDPAVRERAERVKQQELAVIRQVDYTMVHSTVERDVLAAECSSCPVAVFGWVADAVGTTVPYESRRDLLFVGGFQHPPNVDAVLFFVREVLPLIRERVPDVRLHVVGSNPPAAIRELESDAVIIEGFVPDLRPLFDHVRVAVAPVRFGAGVKGKVATAMAHGVPSVATRMAAEGMDLVADRDIVVADAPADFANAVCDVYSNPARWNALSKAGPAAVEREFSSARAAGVISGVLDELGVAVPRDDVHVARLASQGRVRRLRRGRGRRAGATRQGRGTARAGRRAAYSPSTVSARAAAASRRFASRSTSVRSARDAALPNWREQLICACGLNSRMRAAVHALQSLLRGHAGRRDLPDGAGLSAVPTLFAHAIPGSLPASTSATASHSDSRLAAFETKMRRGSRSATPRSTSSCRSRSSSTSPTTDRRFVNARARCEPGGRLVFTAPFVAQNHENAGSSARRSARCDRTSRAARVPWRSDEARTAASCAISTSDGTCSMR